MQRTRDLRRAALRVECLEDRSVPSAGYDPLTVAVGFHTGDPADPVAVRAVPVDSGQTVEDALAAWRAAPGVAYAEPNYTFGAGAVIPNDTYFGDQYALNNAADADLDAPEAWGVTTGGTGAVVAVIDSGVDYTHPDLYLNIWVNQAEIPAAVRAVLLDTDADGLITFWDLNNAVNLGVGKITDLNGNGRIDGGDVIRPVSQGGWADGSDAGGNGYTDDLIGWDFVGNDNNPMDVVANGGGHGTHVAGTIGAVGNNGIGVAGVAWRAQLMPVRFLGADGGTSVAAAAAIRYSAANGAVVSNNSWGGPNNSQTIYNAVVYARSFGQVFVTASGNEGLNNDLIPDYPGNYALDNIVSVAATDAADRLTTYSNYGRATVDLGAPGDDVLGTYPGARYAYISGTSMAAPHVSGAFALLLSREPGLGYSGAITRVLTTVDPISSLSGTTVSGGRLNVFRALGAGTLSVPGAVPPGAAPPGAAASGGRASSVLAVGVEPGVRSQARLVDARTGATLRQVDPFPGYFGGITAASGDVNRDGFADLIVGAGPGVPGGHVKVFDGATGAELRSFYSFVGFDGGVNVAAGDIDGDGLADVIVGAGPGAPGGHVKVFSGATGAEVYSFFAYGLGFVGGASVAAGDVDGDGRTDFITGSGAGAPSGHVKVFSGRTGAELMSFLAYIGFDGGVRVSAGDLDGDGKAEVLTGTFGAAPHVKAFAGSGRELASFYAFDPAQAKTVDVAGADADGDGRADLIAAAKYGQQPQVGVYRGTDFAPIGAAFALDDIVGGVEVG